MAENIWEQDSDQSALTDKRRKEIISEALRQSESCLYTSTAFYEWLKWVRVYHYLFIALPIILGGLAGITLLKDYWPNWIIATLAFLAALFPALAEGMKIQTSVSEITRLAIEFKSLQDRFRQLGRITAPFINIIEADKLLNDLVDKMDLVRKNSMAVPEWAFNKAQAKIDAGHYDFTVDQEKSS